MSNSHSKAATAYNKKNTIAFTIRLNTKTDDDIIAALETVGNKNALIKKLLRAAIEEAEADGSGSDEIKTSHWVDNWVEDPTDDDGGHFNGIICSNCSEKGTARPFHQVTEFCPDCGAAMFNAIKKAPAAADPAAE